jgi:hypothetical protein
MFCFFTKRNTSNDKIEIQGSIKTLHTLLSNNKKQKYEFLELDKTYHGNNKKMVK